MGIVSGTDDKVRVSWLTGVLFISLVANISFVCCLGLDLGGLRSQLHVAPLNISFFQKWLERRRGKGSCVCV